METLTQEEIIVLKVIAAEKFEELRQEQVMKEEATLSEKIGVETQKIADRYKPLLDEAESLGNIILRKQLIEQQTEEARAKEIEIRGAVI